LLFCPLRIFENAGYEIREKMHVMQIAAIFKMSQCCIQIEIPGKQT